MQFRATSVLQSAYSDHQIGPFENLHQPVKNTPLIVLGTRLKVVFQYSLRFADCPKSQLLISHCFHPKKWLTGEAHRGIKSALRVIPSIFVSAKGLQFVWPMPQGPKCGLQWEPSSSFVKRGHLVTLRTTKISASDPPG